MKRCHVSLGAGLVLLVLSSEVMAQFASVNGLRIQLRRFNDYSGSTLNVTPAPPPPGPGAPVTYAVAGLPDVTINEGPFGAGGFANQHVVRFSNTAGATDYRLTGPVPPPPAMSPDAFDIGVDVTLAVGSATPAVKEAGFRSDTFVAGEQFFILKTNGEVAAFGGAFPFHSFGAAGSGTYVPGNRARLRMVYSPDDDPNPVPGDASTIQYFYDNDVTDATPAVASPVLEFSNLENGLIAGSDFGVYVQSPPNDDIPSDFSNARFQNFRVVPEPATAGVLLAGMFALVSRKRH